jgi:hypothetical protein
MTSVCIRTDPRSSVVDSKLSQDVSSSKEGFRLRLQSLHRLPRPQHRHVDLLVETQKMLVI